MGAWGFGILDDDVAMDVRDRYLDLLKCGKSSAVATRTVQRDLREEFEDEDDGPTAWMALALAQWQVGWLDQKTLTQALHAIDSGMALRLWEESPKLLAKRKSSLQKFRATLTSSQPAQKEFRPQKKSMTPSFTKWVPGEYFRFQLRKGLFVLLRLTGVSRLGLAFAIVEWHGAETPAATEIIKLPVNNSSDFIVVTKTEKDLPGGQLVRLGIGKKIPAENLGLVLRSWTKVPHLIKKRLKLQ